MFYSFKPLDKLLFRVLNNLIITIIMLIFEILDYGVEQQLRVWQSRFYFFQFINIFLSI